jgi:transcriptional regulator with XRE-family HTH domain
MPPVPTVLPDGAAIRRLRTRRGMTPSDIATAIGGGRHPKTIGRLEYAGKPASEVLICQVANVLGVNPSEIILGEPSEAIREHLSASAASGNGDGEAA